MTGNRIKNVDAALQKIRDTEDFWINLKPTPNADKLLGIIKKIKGEYNILSAPMTGDPRVEPSKREWIKKNLTAFPPKESYYYCGQTKVCHTARWYTKHTD